MAPFHLPAYSAADDLAAVEPGLWALADQMHLPDEACERLGAALAALRKLSSGQEHKLLRFAADYARLRMWVGRGRVDWMVKAVNQMLENALA